MAMELVKWSTSYELGLNEIDEQHKSLFFIINKTWDAIIVQADKSAVLKLVEELEVYTLAHFAAEETFMRVTNYPGFDEHKLAHQHFVARIAAEKDAVINGGHLTLDLMHFLKDWLVDHILVSDQSYAAFTRRSSSESTIGRFFKRFF